MIDRFGLLAALEVCTVTAKPVLASANASSTAPTLVTVTLGLSDTPLGPLMLASALFMADVKSALAVLTTDKPAPLTVTVGVDVVS